jgi:transcriptional regulator with XRE-family HTH domain
MNEEFELTPEEIEEIKTLREQGLSYRNIAKKTGRSLGIVAKYCKGIRPLVLEEKDLLDYLEPKLNRLEQQVDRLKENQRDLIWLVFQNLLVIAKGCSLKVDEAKLDIIREKLLSSLED